MPTNYFVSQEALDVYMLTWCILSHVTPILEYSSELVFLEFDTIVKYSIGLKLTLILDYSKMLVMYSKNYYALTRQYGPVHVILDSWNWIKNIISIVFLRFDAETTEHISAFVLELAPTQRTAEDLLFFNLMLNLKELSTVVLL